MNSVDLVAALETFIRSVVRDMNPDSDCSDALHLHECRELLVNTIDKELKDE